MAKAKHSVRIDMNRKLLRIECVGFWSIDDVHEYHRAQSAALRNMASGGIASADVRIFIDCSQHMPQALDVISELDRVLSSSEPTGKVAVLVSSVLVARQSGRSGPEHRIFYDEREAIDWLFAD